MVEFSFAPLHDKLDVDFDLLIVMNDIKQTTFLNRDTFAFGSW